ncbi:MAG: hypothetical protein V3T22_08770 [Planctomycetota bacterium]
MQHQPWILILALLSVSLFFQDPPAMQDPDTGLSGTSRGVGQNDRSGWFDIPFEPLKGEVTTYTVPADRTFHLRLVLRRVDGLGGVLEGQIAVNGVRVDRAVGGNFGLKEGDVAGATDGSTSGILFQGEIARAGDVISLSRFGTDAPEETIFVLRGFLEAAPR